MEAQFGTVLSIIGFYLSLISLLGSLFFIHLGNWYKDISTTEQKWTRYKLLDTRDKHIECYLEAFDEKSPVPLVGFVLLTAFMVVLGVFALNLRALITGAGSLESYLYVPMFLFFALYFVGSMIFLVLGYRKVSRLFQSIDRKISE
jgi:hypothetical protein